MCAFGLGLLSLSSTFPWVWLVHVAQPSFVVTPQDKVVGVGRRVSLRCQVTGNPVPAVFWNKESSQVRCTVDSICLNLTPNYALLLACSWSPSATVVSAEPFSHGKGTLRCLQKEMATYRHWSVSLWRDPDDVPHCQILSPDKTEWRLISATLCGWRRCFVADQLWFMTCIREEEESVELIQGGT